MDYVDTHCHTGARARTLPSQVPHFPDTAPLPLRDAFPYSHLMAVQISIHNLSYNLHRGANWQGASVFCGHGPVAFGTHRGGFVSTGIRFLDWDCS